MLDRVIWGRISECHNKLNDTCYDCMVNEVYIVYNVWQSMLRYGMRWCIASDDVLWSDSMMYGVWRSFMVQYRDTMMFYVALWWRIGQDNVLWCGYWCSVTASACQACHLWLLFRNNFRITSNWQNFLFFFFFLVQGNFSDLKTRKRRKTRMGANFVTPPSSFHMIICFFTDRHICTNSRTHIYTSSHFLQHFLFHV